jgi:RNA polymerase sigma-70 factor (ECF subfamily)
LSGFREEIQAAIPALRRYARALTRDRELADDLVQDTLVRALRSERLFHGGEVRNWLFTILTNLNRNRLRALSRRPQHAPLEDTDAADVAGPEAGGRDIARALAALGEDQRAALLLVVLEGLSYREVGRRAGRSDRNRDVAARAGAGAGAGQGVSRRRASGPAPGEMTKSRTLRDDVLRAHDLRDHDGS